MRLQRSNKEATDLGQQGSNKDEAYVGLHLLHKCVEDVKLQEPEQSSNGIGIAGTRQRDR